MTRIDTISIVEAGTMGSGIAQACAQSGYSILLYNVKPGLTIFKVRENQWAECNTGYQYLLHSDNTDSKLFGRYNKMRRAPFF